MTKSTITREQLLEIIETDHVQCGEASYLARMALAAMASEHKRNPVLAYADSYRDMAKQGVESVPIWSVITDLERNIAPLYRHAQPVPVTEREPIAWLNDAYLARGVVDGEAGSEDAGPGYIPVYREAQPAPVVPEDVRLALSIMDDEIIAELDAEESACRAAMLAAAQHDTPALNSVQSVDSVADRWIPVSEQMPEEDTDVIVYCSDTEEQFVAYHNCNGYFHYATYEKKGEGYVDIVCNPTHWQPLPEPPQEENP